VAPDITLPEAADTITVWVRCWGRGPSAFGLEWSKLEDLGVTEAK
jgi:hypothetical protein